MASSSTAQQISPQGNTNYQVSDDVNALLLSFTKAFERLKLKLLKRQEMENSRQGNSNDLQGLVDVTALTEEFEQLEIHASEWGGSGSGTCSTDGQPSEQVTIIIDDYLLDKLKELDDATKPKMPDTQQNTKPRIQKIPPALLRKETTFEGYYEPKVVAFGPIHHNNQRLANGEKVKRKLAAHLKPGDCYGYGNGDGNGFDREGALKEIIKKIEDLKGCYQERWPYSERDLAFMFLIDGCAMLHFMKIVVFGDKDSLLQECHVNYDFIGFAIRDMFLLENQLPYQLLMLLISFSSCRGRTIFTFAIEMITSPTSLVPEHDQLEHPLHLLDLLHSNMTIGEVGNSLRYSNEAEQHDDWQHHYMQATFRTAKELKSSGIMLKQSATSSMNGVSFHQGFFSGTLSLPSITVDDSSTCMLLNLMAYEMCPGFKNELEVTSYVCFLDSLIDQSEDVRELRQARILRNHLGSDEDVAKLFNKMGSGLVPNPMKYRYIKGQMYKQHKNMGIIRTWVAGVKETYFSNPWTFLAVCGAIFGLVLTFIQTWYAVKSYYDNPKF